VHLRTKLGTNCPVMNYQLLYMLKVDVVRLIHAVLWSGAVAVLVVTIFVDWPHRANGSIDW
jgi:hypothetical protein